MTLEVTSHVRYMQYTRNTVTVQPLLAEMHSLSSSTTLWKTNIKIELNFEVERKMAFLILNNKNLEHNGTRSNHISI